MKRLRSALLIALVLLTAGCSAIPSSGPVNSAPAQDSGLGGNLGFIPARPTANAQRADIVRGFLNAATGQANQYEIARSYLTTAFAKVWNPTKQVTVYDGGVRVNSDGSSATVPATAVINAAGTYQQVAAPVAALRFTLVQVGGQWRISHAADGLVLPATYLVRLFTPYTLRYFSPGWGAMVPDLRWFANTALTPSTVVRSLLAGAVGPVADPVTATAFPAGTRLRGVTTSGSRVVVDLAYARAPGPVDLQRARRQLEETLSGLKSLSGIRVVIAVDGIPQPSVRVSSLQPVTQQDAPLVLQNGRFGYLANGRLTGDTVLGAAVVKARPTAVTASDSLAKAAALTSAGAVLITPKGTPQVVDDRAGVIAPTLDPEGWVWSIADSGLRATFGSRSVSLTTPVDPSDVVAIEASRDGTRLLLVVGAPSGPRVLVAGIVRASDGSPKSLTRVTDEYLPTEQDVVDATWVDAGTIAVLTRLDSGNDPVTTWQIGNEAQRYGQLRSASHIVGGTTLADLTALTGRELQQTANGEAIWQSVTDAADIDVLAVQR